MKPKEIKTILTNLQEVAGEKGGVLASALIRAYAGIGRGIDGKGCIAYLADLTRQGVLRIESGAWSYHDADGVRRLGGGSGDKVLPTIAKLAVRFHNRAGYAELDEYDILARLQSSSERVQEVLNSR